MPSSKPSRLPDDRTASSLIANCCRALLGSFKIRQVATVGGKLCLSLPPGPAAALGTALEATCEIWTTTGPATLPCEAVVRGDQHDALGPGDILRALHIAETPGGPAPPSAASRSPRWAVPPPSSSARTDRSLRADRHRRNHPPALVFDRLPSPAPLLARLHDEIRDWHDDVHGAPDWRAHITALLATEMGRSRLRVPKAANGTARNMSTVAKLASLGRASLGAAPASRSPHTGSA